MKSQLALDNQVSYHQQVFEGLEASEQELVSATFEGCTFKGCDFSGAAFRRCSFVECDFIACNLSVASFSYSKLSAVRFIETKLIGVDWTAASWPSLAVEAPVSFYRCILDQGVFHGLFLEGLVMEFCRAQQVDFGAGRFRNASFIGSEFSGAVFQGTDISASDFSEATGFDIDITQNTVGKAKFSRFEALNLLENLGIELVD